MLATMLDGDASVNSSTQSLGIAAGPTSAPPSSPPPPPGSEVFSWTAGKVVLSLALFLAAGLCEIGGGWLVWQAVRLHKGWWLAALGAVVLFGYGLIPCAQPVDNFGRVGVCQGGNACLLAVLPWRVPAAKAPACGIIPGARCVGAVAHAHRCCAAARYLP